VNRDELLAAEAAVFAELEARQPAPATPSPATPVASTPATPAAPRAPDGWDMMTSGPDGLHFTAIRPYYKDDPERARRDAQGIEALSMGGLVVVACGLAVVGVLLLLAAAAFLVTPSAPAARPPVVSPR